MFTETGNPEARRCVDARHLAVLDLGDAGLEDTEDLGKLGLGGPAAFTHLGELVFADAGFPALPRSRCSGRLLGVDAGWSARALAYTSAQLAYSVLFVPAPSRRSSVR
jgi:hypothetical protein